MTPDHAAHLVAATRRDAETAASRDLARLRSEALQAGQRRALAMFPTGRADPKSVLNARGSRILRGWYLEVFSASLRQRLGEQVAVPAAAGIDATGTALKASLGSRNPDLPLRLAGLLHVTARNDAAATTTSLRDILTRTAERRSMMLPATDTPATGDVRAAILQHWYQRCYLADVDAQLGLLQPLQAVTAAEAREVAAAVHDGQARRLIGADGIPLVTVHSTAMTDTDRRLAAGHTGVVEAPAVEVTNPLLRIQVTQSWGGTAGQEAAGQAHARRVGWAAAAGLPAAVADHPWHQIAGPAQSRLIAVWLDTHRLPAPRLQAGRPPPDPLFHRDQHALPGPPGTAAAAMFNHPPPPPATPQQAAAAMFPAKPRGARTRQASAAETPSTRVRRDVQQGVSRNQER